MDTFSILLHSQLCVIILLYLNTDTRAESE